MVVTSPEHRSMMKSWVIWMFFFHGTEYTLTKQSLVGRDAMWTVVSCSNTSFSFSVLCSVSILSSSSSDFCNSTSEALDTLKIPWILTRTFTLTFELSPEAWGTTFWMTYWPAWEFQCTCLHTECIMTKTVQWKYAMRRKEHVQGPEYLPPLQVAGELRMHDFSFYSNRIIEFFLLSGHCVTHALASLSVRRHKVTQTLWFGSSYFHFSSSMPGMHLLSFGIKENYFPAKTLNVHFTLR